MSESTLSPLSLLRERTADLHDQLETLLGDRFFGDESLTVDDFRALLGGFLRVYSPLEPKLQKGLDRHIPKYEYVHRTPLLRDDLLTLGMSQQKLEERFQHHDSPSFSLDHPAGVLGCLYVVEGSEMGKKVIRRQLQNELADEHLAADSFFHDNAEQIRKQWNEFQSTLDEEVHTKQEKQHLVETAQNTFDWFRVGFS